MPLTNGDILVYNGTQWVSQQSVPGPFDIDSPTFHVDSTNHRVGIGTTSPNSTLHVAGSVSTPVTTVTTTPYNIALTDSVILVNGTSITLNLPSSPPSGQRITVRLLPGSSGVTVASSYPQNIEGYLGSYSSDSHLFPMSFVYDSVHSTWWLIPSP
jgi:hypothetical protein